MAIVGILLVAGVGALVALTVHDFVRRPNLRRLAVRNLARRPGEAALVVLGSMFATAIIGAAFIVGDTFDASVRDVARTRLGPIDEQVVTHDPDVAGELADALLAGDLAGTDGALAMVSSPAAVSAGARAEPATSVAEVDFDAARAFGDDPAATGLADAGTTPLPGEAVVNERLAGDLGVEAGDLLTLHAYDGSTQLEVRTVLDEVGLAGHQGIYVAPGTLQGLGAPVAVDPSGGDASPGAQPPAFEVLVSNDGGVFDGADGSEQVLAAIEERIAPLRAAGASIEVLDVKREIIDDAEAQGASIRELFSTIGAFSVLVGILLLVNLFVMLGEERKRELGMLRAVGLRRGHLMRVFGLEGALYAVLAAVAGAVVAVGVGGAIVLVTRRILSGEDIDIVFSVQASSVLTGAVIGLVISLATVWATSARIARLNVIRAIRDLADVRTDRPTVARSVLAALGVAAGTVLTVAGVGGDAAVPAMAGPPVALLAAIPVLRGLVGRRRAVVGATALSLLWCVAVFVVAPGAMEEPDIEVFVVQGVVMVAAAVGLVSQADRLWARLADRVATRGGGLSLRLALAYPLARTGRTGIQLAMFSLVVFTMTFMAVMSGIFTAQAPTFAAQAGGEADIFVDSNPANPLSAADLEADRDVEAAVPLLRGSSRFTSSHEPEPTPWALTGIDERLLDMGTPHLSAWDERFGSAQEAYAAVIAEDALAVVPEFFLDQEGGPPEAALEPGEQFRLVDPSTGTERTLTVAAVTDSDFTFNGVLVARSTAAEVLGARAVERHHVTVVDGADPEAVADRLTASFVANGAEASAFLGHIEDELAEEAGFFRLMQGYLALGLVIGVAGLGVVMVRAVRERRRQIGMLRAMGFGARLVRRAFLLEAGLIAAQGVALGMVLGVVCSYQLFTMSDAFGEQSLPFSVPWAALAVLLAAPLTAAIAAAAWPSSQAAAIRPAVALRVAD